MTTRHRRRSVHAEAIAPWMTLSVILLIWWAGAKTLDWARPGQDPLGSVQCWRDRSMPKNEPVDRVPPEPSVVPRRSGPTISANTMVLGSDLYDLRGRSLVVPVRGLDADDLSSSFHDARGSRQHEAIDILAPRGTDVLAVENGTVAKLFSSRAGGLDDLSVRSVREIRLLLRASRQVCTQPERGNDGAEGRRVGSGGNDRQCPCEHPASPFLDLEARSRQAMVGRDRARSVSRLARSLRRKLILTRDRRHRQTKQEINRLGEYLLHDFLALLISRSCLSYFSAKQ